MLEFTPKLKKPAGTLIDIDEAAAAGTQKVVPCTKADFSGLSQPCMVNNTPQYLYLKNGKDAGDHNFRHGTAKQEIDSQF